MISREILFKKFTILKTSSVYLVTVYGLGDRLHIIDESLWRRYIERDKNGFSYVKLQTLCKPLRIIDHSKPQVELKDKICLICLSYIKSNVDIFTNIFLNDVLLSSSDLIKLIEDNSL